MVLLFWKTLFLHVNSEGISVIFTQWHLLYVMTALLTLALYEQWQNVTVNLFHFNRITQNLQKFLERWSKFEKLFPHNCNFGDTKNEKTSNRNPYYELTSEMTGVQNGGNHYYRYYYFGQVGKLVCLLTSVLVSTLDNGVNLMGLPIFTMMQESQFIMSIYCCDQTVRL